VAVAIEAVDVGGDDELRGFVTVDGGAVAVWKTGKIHEGARVMWQHSTGSAKVGKNLFQC
jgi:hypothetical protein